jgi:hypothetical protein
MLHAAVGQSTMSMVYIGRAGNDIILADDSDALPILQILSDTKFTILNQQPVIPITVILT